MMNSITSIFKALLLVGLAVPTLAFCTGRSLALSGLQQSRKSGVNQVWKRAQQQYMAPRFDISTQQWIPDEETVASDGYGPIGTLLRQGPKPFVIRLSSSKNYEQGVYKLMANEKWDLLTAQGNFDAYLENPNDWAYQYFQEKKGVTKKDYVNDGMDTKSLVLKGIWTTLVLSLGARGIYCYGTGDSFYDPLIALLSKQ